jgi:broad specificity phosphatase PhoE
MTSPDVAGPTIPEPSAEPTWFAGWPAPGLQLAELIAVRHGQSRSNELIIAANREGRAEVVGLPDRDADVPLSTRGEAEAAAFGRWVASLPPDEAPELVVASPYRRARDTAAAALAELAAAGRPVPALLDERLRDREIGIFTLMTEAAAVAAHPTEVARRKATGSFYYRAPGGESHVDVALRLRSFLADLARIARGKRVLLVAHDSVVVLLRYVIEGLSEADLEQIAAAGGIRNASVTRWRCDGGALRLVDFNRVEHLDG